ncbi:hypothetical protein EM308_04805 [Flavobacterium gilvum]|uniref:Uncharacterized protein n=1 Tax=Flavobacterium gilvum TaxID=1492737 RepID=A0AAC9N549_9FLAO|nr:hypothetical protein EM308_04805 [Flavobacterium gilvum]KFC60957.1 hypothetical protein FEM08_02680 [Flavobacterium gilvum]
MTKRYQLFSLAYRIILGLFIVVFTIKSLFFPDPSADNAGVWSLLFSIVTLPAITIFHRLGNENRYKIIVQFFVCALVLISLSFLLFLFLTPEDGNLLVNSVFVITIFVNAGLLFYLIQDKKFNHNG